MSTPILAQVIVNNADEISQAISEGWDTIWDTALDSELYTAVNNVGIACAIATLALWLYKFYQSLQDQGTAAAWSEILIPVIVIIFLANDGQNLKTATLGMRNGINQMNNSVLESVNAENDLEDSLADLAEFSSAQTQVAELRQACDNLTNNEELTQCLQQQRARADELVGQLQGSNLAPQWLQNIQEMVEDNFAPTATGVVRFINTPGLIVAEAIITAFQAAFQLAIEVSMLLTGLMGPIAVGTSLLPIGAKPVYAWLTAFWSLGICKLSLNIITGLVATSIHEAGPDNIDTLSTAIALGILSPVLALGLAAGGGMAIFNGILHASSSALRSFSKSIP
jgi:hypothetical protein